ncbi:hypothetical protein SMICM304S_00777 [Streptomyces microflavus]
MRPSAVDEEVVLVPAPLPDPRHLPPDAPEQTGLLAELPYGGFLGRLAGLDPAALDLVVRAVLVRVLEADQQQVPVPDQDRPGPDPYGRNGGRIVHLHRPGGPGPLRPGRRTVSAVPTGHMRACRASSRESACGGPGGVAVPGNA